MKEEKNNNLLSSSIKEKEPLSQELQIYLQKIEGIKISFPHIMQFYLKRIQKGSNGFLKFLESRTKVKKEGENSYQIKVDEYYHFTHIVDSIQRNLFTVDTLSQSFIISLVSQYDAFMGKLLKWIYSNKPELLNISEKYISYPELMKFKSFEEAKESIIEKEVDNFLRESHSKQIIILENLLKITLTKGLDIWPTFIELTERRNLFVHANGVVSRQYLVNCTQSKVKLENIKIGDHLSCPPDYINQAYYILFEMAFKLSQVVRRKLLPDKIDQADDNVINTSFNLLLKEEYALVIKLLSFFCYGIKKHSDEKARITIIVNYAIAFIGIGQKDKVNEILDKEDWSIVSNEYQLAYLTLKGKFKEVAEKMVSMGENSKISKNEYLVWPLFKKFRKSQYFRNAFKKVFHEEYVTIKKTDEFKILSNLIKV